MQLLQTKNPPFRPLRPVRTKARTCCALWEVPCAWSSSARSCYAVWRLWTRMLPNQLVLKRRWPETEPGGSPDSLAIWLWWSMRSWLVQNFGLWGGGRWGVAMGVGWFQSLRSDDPIEHELVDREPISAQNLLEVHSIWKGCKAHHWWTGLLAAS